MVWKILTETYHYGVSLGHICQDCLNEVKWTEKGNGAGKVIFTLFTQEPSSC
jgi:hypothetical protein